MGLTPRTLIVVLGVHLIQVTQSISTTKDEQHLEAGGTARIVRKEDKESETASLIQSAQRSANPALELEPNVIGDAESTTNIIQSGAGPTTTAIYAVGSGPIGGPAGNARELTPSPPNYYEPGPPGIPGPPGPPGPPGDPGPTDYMNGTVANGTIFHSGAGGGGPGYVAPPLGVYTQSGYEIRGPPGGVGPLGPAGPQGVIGTMGLEGQMGRRGWQGAPGEAGPKGGVGARHAVSAAPKKWLYYAFAINGGIAIIVLAWSYVEFVVKKPPFSYLCLCGCCKKDKQAYTEGEGEW